MSKELVELISNMSEKEAIDLVNTLLEKGEDPLSIMNACSEAMDIVGKRFESGEYFLPHLMMAGEILKAISEIVKPLLAEATGGGAKKGKVLIATVEGDIHDIGKDIVVFMLDVNGFEVLDMGVDVPIQKVVDAVKDFKPQVVGLSGFLTLAFDAMKFTIDAMQEAGVRDDLKVMIGGGMIDETVMKYTGADAFGKDAMAAVALSKKWIGVE